MKKLLTISTLLTIIICLFAIKADSLDYPHTTVNQYNCGSCHYVWGSEPTLLKQGLSYGMNIDDTIYNALCWSCHNDSIADYVNTHSSRQIDDSYGNWSVECRTCHNPHSQRQIKANGSDSYLTSGIVSNVTTTTLTDSSKSWSSDEFAGLVLIPNVSLPQYGYKIVSNSGDTITVESSHAYKYIDTSKVTATVDTYAVIYGKLIKSTIDTNDIIDPGDSKPGEMTVKFFNDEGTNSFADGPSPYDGVCEVCHTMTTHFQNDGGGSDQLHSNLSSPPAGTDCIECHSHTGGFAHGGGAGVGCDECHGHDPGYPGVTGGGGTYHAHSTHTEDGTESDDFTSEQNKHEKKGPKLACSVCHNTSSFPDFADGVDYADYKSGAQMTTVCNTCHSPNGSYNGVTSNTIGAKYNWSESVSTDSKVYTADGELRAGKEKWCAGCHDEDPSEVDSISAPNVIGDEDGSYNYGTGWGFYKTGHGVPSSSFIPSNGGIKDGPGRGCLDCHDSLTSHVDGEARTFSCSSSSGGACTTSYNSGYRLKEIDGNPAMEMPRTGINVASFRLCFSCHTNTDSWIAGESTRGETNFWTGSRNDHYFHLISPAKLADHDWDGVNESWLSCILCHNVHGSRNPAMMRSGELTGNTSMSVRYGNSCSTHTAGNEEPNPNNITLAVSTKSTMKGVLGSAYCQHCHGTGTGIVGYTRDPIGVPDIAPELNWVGGPAYESDGVNPDAGVNGTEFTFKVKYSDVNSDGPPSTIQLWIDRNNDGSYDDNADPDLDEKIDMTSAFAEVDECGSYNTGVDYVTTATIDKVLAAGNTVKYKFYAYYGASTATGPPTNESTLTILNNAPSLAWTDEANFTSDGVNPDYGPKDGTYKFRVKYTDDDGDTCPASGSSDIQVWIDVEGDGYEADDKFNLTEVSTDADCSDGKLYYTNRTLPNSSGSDASYNYRFYAYDGTDEATGTPASSGGSVTVAGTTNKPPFLAWESGTCRPLGAYPPKSATSSKFVFTVRYYDDDNQCPTSGSSDIQVWFDINGVSGYEAGEKYNMTEVDSDADCTTAGGGKLYSVNITPTTVADNLAYEFHATDGTDEALGDPRTTGGTVDVISADYVVKQDGSEDYTTISDAITNSASGETILVYDGTYNEYVTKGSGVYYNMNLYSACGPADTTISSTNDPIVYTYRGGTSTIDGFTITGSNGRGFYAAGNDFDLADSQPTINNCIIHDNDGRGVASYRASVTITNSEIYGNRGGGVESYAGSIIDSTIRNNSVTGNGGGIASQAEAGAFTLNNVVIRDNTATGHGGGIYCDKASGYGPSYEKVTLSGNQSTGGNGGGGYFTLCAPTFTNSLVSNNSARYGGGLALYTSSTAVFKNSTIVHNTASPGDGGAYYTNGLAVKVHLVNSIVWSNRADGLGHIGRFAQSSGSVVDANIYDSIIENNGDEFITDDNYFSSTIYVNVVDTGTNYDADPNFSDAGANGDYHIRPPSDAIDNAADNSGLGIPTDDLEGNSRTSGYEDIGAYEYQTDGSDSVPVLAWTGQTGYASDGVDPDAGLGGASYEFRVQYTHDDNVAPDPIQVWVDQNGNEAYESDEKYDMITLISGDTYDDGNYTNGERYTKTTAVYNDGGGDVKYRFYASDGQDISTDDPTLTKTLHVENMVPVLSWVGDTNYESDGVNPDAGISGTTFTFRVLYTDSDNLSDAAPLSSVVYVDLNDDGSYDDGSEMFSLSAESGSGDYHDGNYANGEIFVSSGIDVSYSGDGVINYRFSFTDGIDSATGTPASDSTLSITQQVSGAVYTDEGTTPIGSGAVVHLVVNGSSQGTAETNGSGQYAIQGTYGSGDSMLVYIDGHASDGATVTVSDGSAVTGLNIYADRLIVRHDNSGSLTNANMDAAKGSLTDSEILYSVDGSDNMTTTATELHVLSGHSYAPGASVTAVNVDINGTFNPAANAVNLSGSWDATGGVFTSTGTVTFSAASGTKSIVPGGTDAAHDFQNIVFNDAGGSATFQLGGAIDLDGSFTLTDGIVDTTGSNYAITVGGNFSQAAAGQVEANASTIAVAGNFTIDGTLDNTDYSSAAVILNGTADQTVTCNGSILNNLTLNNGGSSGSDDIIVSGALDVNGTLTITDGDLDIGTNDPAVNTAGSLTVSSAGSIDVTGRTANWTFDGTSTLTDSSSSGPQDLEDVVLNGTSLTLASNVKVQTLTNTAGTFDMGSSGYVLEIDGTGTPLSNSGTLNTGTSTIKYSGSGTATNVTTLSYSSLQLAPTSATTYSLTGNLTGGNALPGNMTIGSNATLTTTANNYNIALAGDWSNSGTFTANTGTVTFIGTGHAVNGSTEFYNFTVADSSDNSADITLTFEAGQTQTFNGTVTLDGLDADDRINLVSSSPGTQWNFVMTVSSTKGTMDYLDVSDGNANGSDASKKPIEPANSIDSGSNTDWFPGGNNPATPNNVSVADEATRQPTLTASAFVDAGDTHQASQWQISTASGAGFDAAIVYDSGAISDLETHTVSILLDPGTTYYWHVRYQDTNDNLWSDYSDSTVQSFSTGAGLPEGAVAYWKLDENGGTAAADSVGSNNGTVYADSSSTPGATWVTGKSGSALDFDNNYDRVLAAYDEQGGLLDYHTAHTVEAWINWDGSSDRDLIFAEGAGAQGYQLEIIGGSNQINYAIRSSSALDQVTASTSLIPVNQWVHVAGTYDGAKGELRLYINGEEAASQTTGIPTSIGNATYSWRIGGARVAYDVQSDSAPSAATSFNGSIDEVIVYNRALSGSEIVSRYLDHSDQISRIDANDHSLGDAGIQAGDEVVLQFNVATNGPTIDANNIDSVLALDNSHSWLDGAGAIGAASWSTTVNTNDTLTISLSTGTSAPDVAVGDTVTLDGYTIRNSQDRSFAGSAVIGGSFGQAAAPKFAVAHWKMDENGGTTAADSIGGNNGSLVNDTTWTTAKEGTSAVTFDGTGDRIQPSAGIGTGLLDAHTAHTIEAWVKRNSDSSTRDLVFSEGGTTDGYEFSILAGGASANVYSIRSGGTLKTVSVAESLIPVGQWTHVVATYDGDTGEMHLYINGDLKGSNTTSIPASIGDAGNGWRIGGGTEADVYDGGTSYDSNHDIDEVVIYNRALSYAEVLERYAEHGDKVVSLCASGCDFDSDTQGINDVIDDAGTVDGTLVIVYADGSPYQEYINYDGKNIIIRAKDGASATTIEGVNGSGTDPVVTFSGGEKGAILDGFRIDSYNATNTSRGIYISNNSTPTIKNAVVAGNTTPTWQAGSGIYVTGGGVTIENCTIGGSSGDKNTGGNGAGLYVTTTSYDINVMNSTLTYNDANALGGAIYLNAVTGMTTIVSSTIDNNEADKGGAIYSVGSPLTIMYTSMDNNTAIGTGAGGLWIDGDAADATITGGSIDNNYASGVGGVAGGIYVANGADLTYTGGTINGNAVEGARGGAIYVVSDGTTMNLSNMEIKGNRADNRGGAIYLLGGVSTSYTLTNCTITGNSVGTSTWEEGGGIRNYGVLNIYNSTIAGNAAGKGGGLYSDGANSSVTVRNSIFWDNTASSSTQLNTGLDVQYSDVEGGYTGTGNIGTDPVNHDPNFVTPAAATQGNPTTSGDFHIQSGSNVVDQGTTTDSPADDIDGDGRPLGSGIDMGSDEKE